VPAHLVLDERDLRPEWFAGVGVVGVTSGASTPEVSVVAVVQRLRELGVDLVQEVDGSHEEMEFALPELLR
jgi:4-hydroxy-3-methylbut-2-enyl diphosphate reductase